MKEVKFCHCKKLRMKHIMGVANLLQKELTPKEKKYFPHTRQSIVTQLSNTGDYFYVIVDQDEDVLAYGHMRTFEDRYKIPALGIAVSKHCRGLGLGELLCRYMIKDIKKKGYEKVMLKVNLQNTKAQRLYGNLGFRQYKKDRKFIWMRKDLNE